MVPLLLLLAATEQGAQVSHEKPDIAGVVEVRYFPARPFSMPLMFFRACWRLGNTYCIPWIVYLALSASLPASLPFSYQPQCRTGGGPPR